uniref:methyltransferase domain-containing protein n=1 Tax=Mammaliicoccus sciuri TaxID=1296 RepID=UPI002896F5E2
LHMQGRVTWYETALDNVPVKKLYDAAVSLLVIHFVKDHMTFLEEIARRLEPGAPLMMAFIQGAPETPAFRQELHMLSLFLKRQGLGKDVF